MGMLSQKFVQEFAREWVESWNAHDLARILSHYADDFEMRSPYIVERMKVPEGVLRGKDAVGRYWGEALAQMTGLRFELENVYAGVDSVTIAYIRDDGKRVAEVLFFDRHGRVILGTAHYLSLEAVSN